MFEFETKISVSVHFFYIIFRSIYSPDSPFEIQAFLRALKSSLYNCVLVICRALKSLNVG